MHPNSPRPHPLDPLSKTELSVAARIIRLHALQSPHNITSIRFQAITLLEPPKLFVLAALGIPTTPLPFGQPSPEPSGQILARQAYATLIDNLTGHSYEATITLGETPLVDSFVRLPENVHPSMSVQELLSAEEIVKADVIVQKLCLDIELTMDKVFCDGWSIGHDERWPKPLRIQQCMMFARPHGPDSNLYAHPLDFIPIVDVAAKKVISIDWIRPRNSDTNSDTSPPPVDESGSLKWVRTGYPDSLAEYLPEYLAKEEGFEFRQDLKPIYVTQPQGVSFILDGNRVHWQKYDFHVGFNYREGLVINTVTYTDNDVAGAAKPTLRPLFYRMSIAEMVVPYGDPGFPHHRKMAFDVGEYGLGMMVNSLELGCDCRGTIAYLDAILPAIDGTGEGMSVKNAICIHEEDAGLSWKHLDYRTGRAHSVRMRKLVVSCICTLANYEYAFYFNFFQDGTVQHEIKLTGIVNTTYLALGEDSGPFGTQIWPRVNAHNHSHIFCLRIDPMVDGLENSIVQSDIRPLQDNTGSYKNHLGNGFVNDKTIIQKATFSDGDPFMGRTWSIVNPSREHYCSGHPAGYKVICKDFSPLFAAHDSIVARRAPFARHGFWVVPFADDKMYPAGMHIPQSGKSSGGIDEWVDQRGNVEKTDVVVYVSFGTVHVPRPEDFPVMPVEVVSVSLKPNNFFRRNPALDVPLAKDEQSVITPYTKGAQRA